MAKLPEKPAEAPANKERYVLVRRYWDGRQEYEPGDVLAFVPGTQPKSARLENAAAPDDAEEE